MSEVRIEVPDAGAASSLLFRLSAAAEVVAANEGRELHGNVRLAELPSVLSVLDEWMAEAGIGSVVVRLDSRRYVLVRHSSLEH